MLSPGAADHAGKFGADDRPLAATTAAVIVSFHPDAHLRDRLHPLIGQVDAILVVDNGSTGDQLAPLGPFIDAGKVHMIANGTNLGIATALNQGAAWAAAKGYDWFLTLDQDAAPGPDLVAEAARVFDAFPDSAPAVIGASSIGRGCAEDPGRAVRAVITAGALHAVSAWTAIGGFREDFFIDYVDVEYCLRARRSGYSVLLACRPTMEHVIGRPRTVKTIVRSFTPSHHDPVRRYYITRNRIRVWRGYWRREPRYVAFDMNAAARELVKLLLFESRRGAKVRAVIRGMIDGIRGATGRAPASMI
jgi:rhamnosyltransferase